MKLRLWFLATDAAHALHRATRRLYLWTIGKASDAENWTDP